MNIERQYLKQLHEALNRDSTWEQLQSDKSLSPAEKKVVELLPLLNDKSDILALKTAFPNIVNAFMEYEGINESQEFEDTLNLSRGSIVKITGNGELPEGVKQGDLGYIWDSNPRFGFYNVQCLTGDHWSSKEFTEDQLELFKVQSLPGEKEDALMKSFGFTEYSDPYAPAYCKVYEYESRPTLKVQLHKDPESENWRVKFYRKAGEHSVPKFFGIHTAQAPEVKDALKIALNSPSVLDDARKYREQRTLSQIAQKLNAQ